MPLVYTLDLVCCGRTWYVSSDSYTGYQIGLRPPAIVDGVDVIPSVPGEQSASLEVVVPGLDVAEAVASGYELAAGTATVRAVDSATGKVYAEIQGALSGVQWGDPAKPVGWMAFTVRQPFYRVDAPLMAPTGRITQSTHPLAYDPATDEPRGWPDIEGKVYPQVWGLPEKTPAYPVEIYGTAPTVVARLLIAGHHVTADLVEISDSAGNTDTFTPENTVDNQGNPVCLVLVTGAAHLVLSAQDPYWCNWSVATTGTSTISPLSTGAGHAASMVAALLASSGISVDLQRAALLDSIVGIAFSGYANDPDTKVWDFLTREILPLVPLAIRMVGDTATLALVDAPRESEMIARVLEGGDWQRISPAQVERDLVDCRSRVTLVYQDGSQTLSMEELEAVGLIQVLRGRSWGADVEEVVESAYVNTLDTATAVLVHLARWQGIPLAVARYRVDPATWAWLEPGEVVELTDRGAGWHESLARVVERSWPGDGTEEILVARWSL